MKRNYLNQITLALLLITVLSVGFVACKKDKLTEPKVSGTENTLLDSETDYVVRRIKAFDNQLKEIKKGASKSDVYLDIDSALWNIESLFNVTYSFPNNKLIDKKVHEIYIELNTEDGRISMDDVNLLYDKIVESVRNVYLNDGFTSDKSLLSIFIDKMENRSDKSKVKIVVVTGKTDYQQFDYEPFLFGPFDKDECWYYGELGGSCDDQYLLSDAAELIEDTVNYYHGYKPERNTIYRKIFVDMAYIALKGNEYKIGSTDDYYLFYEVDCDSTDLYLDANQLNYYYHNEVRVIKNIVPTDPIYSHLFTDDMVFIEVEIQGTHGDHDESGTTAYMHNNYIFYGVPHCVTKDEFGLQKDLLND